MAQSEYDLLGTGLPHDKYLAQCGAYQSARRMVDLVDTILDKVKDDDDRTKSAEQQRADHTRAVTYGTPFWGRRA